MPDKFPMPAQQVLNTTNELVREICTEACESKGQCGLCKLFLLRNSIDKFVEGHTVKQAVQKAKKLEEIANYEINRKHDRKYGNGDYFTGGVQV